jgi:hypothetical protein
MFERDKRTKLEKRQAEALSAIRAEQLNVEEMAQRPRGARDALNDAFLNEVVRRIAEIEEKARHATSTDDLDDLIDDAEQQGQMRAYICPVAEIPDEGRMAIDVIEEWNVPKAVITRLRNSLGQKLEKAEAQPELARGALRALFEEYDSWASYTDDYEVTMQRCTRWLFGATIALPILALVTFHWTASFLIGILCAGGAGSCVSVMAKMPMLEVSLSGCQLQSKIPHSSG